MWNQINAYALLWNVKKHKGIVKVVLDNKDIFNNKHRLVVKSASELSALGDILRHEKPVYFNIGTSSIASGWELIRQDEQMK